jgi:hypothetical protein
MLLHEKIVVGRKQLYMYYSTEEETLDNGFIVVIRFNPSLCGGVFLLATGGSV